jgi:hypothetical protein
MFLSSLQAELFQHPASRCCFSGISEEFAFAQETTLDHEPKAGSKVETVRGFPLSKSVL